MSIEYNKPWIMQRADPFIVRHTDGTYYFTASVPAYDRIVLRKSATLEGLQSAEEKTIWTAHICGPMSHHVWAPELHHIFGHWYIYFAASQREDIWKLRPYVLECQSEDPMAGPWVERGMMHPAHDDEFSFRDFSLDATTFENRGKQYYVWSEKVGPGDGAQIANLYLARMQDATHLETVQRLLTTPDYDWERQGGFWVNEGPAVLKRNGKIFLTYSASATGAEYCMGMLTIDANAHLLDPRAWKKERWPVLKTDESKGLYGPGHNSFTVDEEGNDILVFHCRTEEKIEGNPLYNPNRHTMLQRIKWRDGVPVFDFD